MATITSSSGKQYHIPVFLLMSYYEYQQLRLTWITQNKPAPKPKPPPKSRDTYYE